MDRTRAALCREAGDARRLGGRSDRRDRSDQSRRGALPRRRGDHPLWPHPPHQPRHLRHQRASRPDREGPGGTVQPDGREGRPDKGLPGAPAARPGVRGERQSRGLHFARQDHHAAEGPLRHPDSHALPAHDRGRNCDHGPGVRLPGERRDGAAGPALHQGGGRAAHLRGARLQRDQPELGGLGARLDQQLRIGALQRREARRAPRRQRDRAATFRPALALCLDRRQDRARVRGRGQEGGGPHRAPRQPRRAQGLRSLFQDRRLAPRGRLLRGRMGRRGLRRRAGLRLSRRAARGAGPARGATAGASPITPEAADQRARRR